MIFGFKKVFKNKEGDIHVGFKSPEGYKEGNLDDVKNILKSLNEKKIWRCHVCDDLHIAAFPLESCPTCNQIDAYVEINEKELRNLLEI